MPVDEKDIRRLDERYVKKDDCGVVREQLDKRMDDGEKSAAVLETKLNTMIKILGVIAGAIVGVLVKLLFGV